MFESCPDCPVNAKPLVPHQMRPMSDIIFVGESPGREEVFRGQPFIGPSGQLLRSIPDMSKYRISYVNALMCPVATVEAKIKPKKAYCYDMLWAYIYQCARDGSIVIPLGSFAVRALGLKGGITKLIDRTIIKRLEGPNDEVKEVLVCPAFHPAFILRNMGRREEWNDQVSASMTISKHRQGIDVEIHTDVESFLAIPDGSTVSLDTETDGTDLVTSKVHWLSMSNDGHNCWVFKTDEVPLAQIYMKLRQMKLDFAGSDFDLPMIHRQLGWDLISMLSGDVQIAEHVLDERRSKALEALTFRYLKVPAFKSEMHSWLQHEGKDLGGIVEAPREIVVPYAARDAATTHLVLRRQEEELKKKGLYDYYRRLVEIQQVLIRMHMSGVHVNQEYRAKLSVEYKLKSLRAYKAILDQPSVISYMADEDKEFNPGSPKQLATVLYSPEYEGLKCTKKTDSGNPSTAKDVLQTLRDKSEVAKLVFDYRKYTKFVNAFIDGLPVYGIKVNGSIDTYVYPRPRLTGPKTGRISMSNPNMQQMPWESAIRNIFSSRFPNGCMITADYKQIELRVLAVLAGEERMLEIFAREGDIHLEMAAILYNLPADKVEDWQRRHAKVANFGVVYGQSIEGLAEVFGSTVDEVRAFFDAWHNRFPAIAVWQQKRQTEAMIKGIVTTPFGRVRRIDVTDSHDLRVATNSPVQSTAADIALDGMMSIQSYFDRHSWHSKIVSFIHDEILMDVHPDEKDVLLERLPSLCELDYDWSPIKFAIDVNAGNSWGEVKEMEMHTKQDAMLEAQVAQAGGRR